jgi:hypothetical protein
MEEWFGLVRGESGVFSAKLAQMVDRRPDWGAIPIYAELFGDVLPTYLTRFVRRAESVLLSHQRWTTQCWLRSAESEVPARRGWPSR